MRTGRIIAAFVIILAAEFGYFKTEVIAASTPGKRQICIQACEKSHQKCLASLAGKINKKSDPTLVKCNNDRFNCHSRCPK
jgi:hypothetical protein